MRMLPRIGPMFLVAVLVPGLPLPVAWGQDVTVTVSTSFSGDPNDSFEDAEFIGLTEVLVGPVAFSTAGLSGTGDDDFPSQQVPAGVHEVRVPAEALVDRSGNRLRVGFVWLVDLDDDTATPRSCPPLTREGDVPVTLESGFNRHYDLRVRVVPEGAPPYRGDGSCGAEGPGGPVCPASAVRAPSRSVSAKATRGPTVRSFTIPPTALAAKEFPVVVEFAGARADVSLVVLEEQNFVGGWNRLAELPLARPLRRGTVRVFATCPDTTFPTSSAVRNLRAFVVDEKGRASTAVEQAYTCVGKAWWPKFWNRAGFGIIVVGAYVKSGAEAGAVAGPEGAAAGATLFGALGFVAAVAQLVVEDPPDPNFMVVAEAEVPTLTPVATGAGVPPELAGALDALLASYAQSVGHERALLHAIERAQGAAEAHDMFWYSQHMAAAGRHAGEWAGLLRGQPELTAAVVQEWQRAGHAELAVGSGDVAALQEDVVAGGLPTFLRDALAEVGADDVAVSLVTALLGALDPVQAAASFPSALDDLARSAEAAELATRLEEFAAGAACGGTPAVVSFEGLGSTLALLGAPSLCGTNDLHVKAVQGMVKKAARAIRLAERARTKTRSAARRKLLGKLDRRLARILRQSASKAGKGKIDDTCRDTIADLVGNARDTAEALRSAGGPPS